ncbi:PAS domain-containing protein [Streptomyces sp. NPDC047022]|uniref:PAS domain-containing protein n=1 Tax=Streptomyces sp. NPDC047022 TaxID=3155737 RepID=UPI0033EE4A53
MGSEGRMDASDEILQMATPSALLTLDGAIRRLNAPMARVLGRPVEQCVGHKFGDLLPASQLPAAESLVSHAATTKTVAMRLLEFPGPASASVVCLVEARRVNDPVGGGALVWVHSLNSGNGRDGLLVPFRLAAKAANPRSLHVFTAGAHAGVAGRRTCLGGAVPEGLNAVVRGGSASPP